MARENLRRSDEVVKRTGLFTKNGPIPKGTADATMNILFPSIRSKVDYSEERVNSVFEILCSAGVLEEEIA